MHKNLGYKPILVNFAYNVKELADAYKKKQSLTIKHNKLRIAKGHAGKDDEKLRKIINELEEVDA